MSRMKPILKNGWQIETFVLSLMLQEKARVLFIYNDDYERIQQLQNELNILPTIMDDDTEILENARKFGFDVIFGNINSSSFDEIGSKTFDFIVAENVIQMARYPYDFLQSAINKCDRLVLSNKNRAYWKKRLKFLFYGSHYIRNQYDVIPDDKYAWFNRNPWSLSHKDIVNLCASHSFSINRGITIYRNGELNNMYDIRNSPNWSADTVYYLITEDSTIQPLYKIENSVV